MTTRFAPTVFFDDDRDVQAGHRANIRQKLAVGPQDEHFLQAGRDAGRDLHHARVKVAGKRVDLAQGFHFDREGRIGHRVLVRIKFGVGCTRGRGHDATAVPYGQANRLGGASNRLFAKLCGMGVTSGLSANSAQAEPFRGIVNSIAQASIVEGQSFGSATFKKQLSIIGAIRGGLQNRQCSLFIEVSFKRLKIGLRHLFSCLCL